MEDGLMVRSRARRGVSNHEDDGHTSSFETALKKRLLRMRLLAT
jgi:hypothetical protein